MKRTSISYIYFVYAIIQKYNSGWWLHLLADAELQKQKALHELCGTAKLKMQIPCEYRLPVETVASWKQNLKMHRCMKHLRKNSNLLFSSHMTSLADAWNQRHRAESLSITVSPMQRHVFSAYFILACEPGIFQCIEMPNFCVNQSEKESCPSCLPRKIFIIFSKIFSIFSSNQSTLQLLHLANCPSLGEKKKKKAANVGWTAFK